MSLLSSWKSQPVGKFPFHVYPGIKYQQTPDELIEATVQRGQGTLSDTGALCINTGKFTGRVPKDKFIVKDAITENRVNWNQFNQPVDAQVFSRMKDKMLQYAEGLNELWVRDVQAGDHPTLHYSVRVVNETPWSNLFVSNMFIALDPSYDYGEPDWLVVQLPSFQADPSIDGVPDQQFSLVSFTERMILIGGTGYTGEIKKGIFTVLNFVLPSEHGVLSMHCSANKGAKDDVAVFFGLSGTGKTTLSADPDRDLIGDDEHGWTDEGVFNFEGGCYAKVIRLSEKDEPEIFRAVKRGALLENTLFHPGTNRVNYEDSSITENTRVSYPLSFIPHTCSPARGGHPSVIFFLTCDAYGILPPISRLTTEQAMYQFISGYTAKVAGTETGIKEPVATFSACFGAPFIPLHPGEYASLLGKKLEQHGVSVWLINTGWSGGAYGTGQRMKIGYTRAMISAVMQGKLQQANTKQHPVFGMHIPLQCEHVPDEVMLPWTTWKSREEYDEQANKLAERFINNFAQYEAGVDEKIRNAAPVVTGR